jgi:GNAT superfamily N-acetyltransferase
VDAGDEDFLFSVYASTREQELAGVEWGASQTEAFLRQQFTAQHQWYTGQYDGASFHVVVVDGHRAGRLYVARWPEEIRIMDIALLPEYRGKGIGSALLADLTAEAAEAGKPLTIHVERFNPALRLYLRLGFTVAEDKGVYLLLARPPTSSG